MFVENVIDFIPNRTLTVIPALFHVNRKARREASRVYDKQDNIQEFKVLLPQPFIRKDKDMGVVHDDYVLYHLL